jgi:hypothetical protein
MISLPSMTSISAAAVTPVEDERGQVRQRRGLDEWTAHHVRTGLAEDAALDSASKLASRNPHQVGLVGGDRPMLTCRYVHQLVDLGCHGRE